MWDRGIYMNLTERRGRTIPVEQAVDRGHVKVLLRGEKLRGTYALTRTGRDGEENQWMMVKVKDGLADPEVDLTETAPASVVSGRTIEEVEADPHATWESNRPS